MNSPNGDLIDGERDLEILAAADGGELRVLDEFDALLELNFGPPDDESRNLR